jgi:1,4-dihydroxy-2-naphthoate octaprenyltransferase
MTLEEQNKREWEHQGEQDEREWEHHKQNRDILFANEAFLIGVLQAVSGGSLFAALAQAQTLSGLAGSVALLIFITLLAISLAFAVLAAYLKHQYKMWDVKATASKWEGDPKQMTARAEHSVKNLTQMRRAMVLSLCIFFAALLVLILVSWARLLLGFETATAQSPIGVHMSRA